MKKTFQKIIATVLTSGIALASIAIPASAAAVTDFTDVKTGSWYYDAVEYAADNGLFSGTSNSTFSPNGGMTRGMFVAVLGRKAGVKESDYLRYRFDDVKVGDYYAPFVEWAATYGIPRQHQRIRLRAGGVQMGHQPGNHQRQRREAAAERHRDPRAGCPSIFRQ